MTETEQLADVVALLIHEATEPLIQKVALLEARPLGVGTKEGWDALEHTITDLRLKVATLEAREPIPGPSGPPGEMGPRGERGEQGEPGRDGLDGKDGKDGTPGFDGKDGAPGLHGNDGRDGKDGQNGLHGNDGRDGKDGQNGLNGQDGRDGLSVSSALLTKDGELVLTFSDGHVENIGLVRGTPGLNGKDGQNGLDGKDGRDGLPGLPGRSGDPGQDGRDAIDGKHGTPGANGKDGTNGRDGLGFEDIDGVVFDPTKGYVLRLKRGLQQKDFPLPGVVFDAGVWQFGARYPKGAGVTVKGAWWIAQDSTTTRPGDGTSESAKAWRLAVKGGRDGKPGKDGKDGEPA